MQNLYCTKEESKPNEAIVESPQQHPDTELEKQSGSEPLSFLA